MRTPIVINSLPEEGFYKVNSRVDGFGTFSHRYVPIPARIWLISGERDEAGDLIEDEIFGCHIGGETVPVDRLWPTKNRITREEYNALCKSNERWKHLISTD